MPTVSMGNTSGSILPAEKVSYDGTISGLEADNVQDAIDQLSIASTTQSFVETKVGVTADGEDIYKITCDGTVSNPTVETLRLIFEKTLVSGVKAIETAEGTYKLDSNPTVFLLHDTYIAAADLSPLRLGTVLIRNADTSGDLNVWIFTNKSLETATSIDYHITVTYIKK